MKPEDMPTSIQTTQIDMAVLLKLQEKYDLVLAENARLKAAMDKYSENEMLCNDTIEQPADLRLALNRASYALFQIKRMVPEEIPKFAADEHSAACAVLDGEQPFKRSE